MAYRNFYKPNKAIEQTEYTLTSELHKLQEDLRDLRERGNYQRPQNNYFELDRFLTNKLLLIGGCVLLGIGIAYVFFNSNSNRCR